MDFGVFIVSNRRVKTKEQKDRDPTIWRSGWLVTWFSFSLIVLLFSPSSPWPKGGGEKDSIVKRMEDGTNIIIPEEEGGKKLRPTRVRKKKQIHPKEGREGRHSSTCNGSRRKRDRDREREKDSSPIQEQERRKQYHPKRDGGKQHHPKQEGNSTLLLAVPPSFFWWCCLPLPSFC